MNGLPFLSAATSHWRLIWREWLLSLLVVGLLMFLMACQWLPTRSLDNLVYDTWLETLHPPAHPEIVLVTIDDKSVATLGRWPWRRAVMAVGVDRLQAADSVLLDILFTEPDNHVGDSDDQRLAQAIQRHGRVAIPYALQMVGGQPVWLKPIPILADQAATLCHINIPVDADGLVRRLQLYSMAQPPFNLHCSAMLANWGHVPPMASYPDALMLPFDQSGSRFTTLSFLDVLTGKVPPSFFQGKTVLVGATATGIGDQYAVPVGNHLMSGVEIQATTLATLRDGNPIHAVSWGTLWWMQVGMVGVLFVGMLFIPSRWLPLHFLLVPLLMIFGSWAAFHAGWWISPIPLLMVALLAYPLWSWRRLMAALAYTESAHRRLSQQALKWQKQREDVSLDAAWPESLDNRIAYVQTVARQLGQWQNFMLDSIQQSPDMVVITDPEGMVLLANTLAEQVLSAAGEEHALTGSPLVRQLNRCLGERGWPTDWHLEDLCGLPAGREVQTIDGKASWLIKAIRLIDAQAHTNGFAVTIVDITPLRTAEKSRDQALRFLSHDMRTPQAAILALIEMQSGAHPLPMNDLLARIGSNASKTLALADDFVQLARLQATDPAFATVWLIDMLSDALDQLWPLAKQYGIQLQYPQSTMEAEVNVHREWFTRALVNLISNAIKYSDRGQVVRVAYAPVDNGWEVLIQDQGLGMTAEQIATVFAGFQRFHDDGSAQRTGVGLGMLFVQQVLALHQASCDIQSAVGKGTSIRIVLPA